MSYGDYEDYSYLNYGNGIRFEGRSNAFSFENHSQIITITTVACAVIGAVTAFLFSNSISPIAGALALGSFALATTSSALGFGLYPEWTGLAILIGFIVADIFATILFPYIGLTALSIDACHTFIGYNVLVPSLGYLGYNLYSSNN